MNKQRGASFIFVLVLLAIVGLAFTIGLRLFPIYMNAYTIQTILKEVATESRGMDTDSNQIWSGIEKRLDINDIENISRDNFIYRRDRDGTTIAIKYEARTELIGNLEAVAMFEPDATLTETSNETPVRGGSAS